MEAAGRERWTITNPVAAFAVFALLTALAYLAMGSLIGLDTGLLAALVFGIGGTAALLLIEHLRRRRTGSRGSASGEDPPTRMR